LNTGTRSEGTYYSVFWWFIKMGTAFASFVMGALLVFTSFDEKQNVTADALSGNIAVMKTEAEQWLTQQTEEPDRISSFVRQIESMITNADKLRAHFLERIEEHPDQAEHIKPLIEHVDSIRTAVQGLQSKSSNLVSSPADVISAADGLMQQMTELKKQAP